jgi:hypothetical protein
MNKSKLWEGRNHILAESIGTEKTYSIRVRKIYMKNLSKIDHQKDNLIFSLTCRI